MTENILQLKAFLEIAKFENDLKDNYNTQATPMNIGKAILIKIQEATE